MDFHMENLVRSMKQVTEKFRSQHIRELCSNRGPCTQLFNLTPRITQQNLDIKTHFGGLYNDAYCENDLQQIATIVSQTHIYVHPSAR